MDERARQVFQKAFAVLDSVEAMKAEQRNESFDERYQREAVEADALLERLRVERTEPLNSPTMGKLKPEPKASEMTDADKKWVWQRLNEAAAVIGGEVFKEDAKLLAEIKTLKAEVAGLRADLEAHKADAAGVVSLRGRNVA
jgi:hypothetical protein